MKSLLLVLTLCLFAFQDANAQSCTDSADFKGEVTHVVDDGQGCWAHVEFDYYVPSFYSPLDRALVEKYGIYAEGSECPFRRGQILSGTLRFDLKGQVVFVND